MSKRFRDTEVWAKEWFVALSCAERCAVDYVLSRCDPVGVWCPAFSVAERLIGEPVDWAELPEKTNGNIIILDDGKWWVKDYCCFQYGRIRVDSGSKLQDTLYALLIKHGLWDSYLATVGPKVKSTVGTTVQRKEKELVKEKAPSKPQHFDNFWKLYPRRISKTAAQKAYDVAVKAGTSEETIATGVRQYTEYIKRKRIEVQYIKHPATWLHQGCWEDDYGENKAIAPPLDTNPKCPKCERRMIKDFHDGGKYKCPVCDCI